MRISSLLSSIINILHYLVYFSPQDFSRPGRGKRILADPNGPSTTNPVQPPLPHGIYRAVEQAGDGRLRIFKAGRSASSIATSTSHPPVVIVIIEIINRSSSRPYEAQGAGILYYTTLYKTLDTLDTLNTFNTIDTLNTLDTLNPLDTLNTIDTLNTLNTIDTLNSNKC